MSPALAGGFLTTGPPGKSMKIRFLFFFGQSSYLMITVPWEHVSNLQYVCKMGTPSWEITHECVLAAQSCLTLCDPMDCSSPGSSIHGILQARILEWVAIPFSRGSSRPRDRTQVS